MDTTDKRNARGRIILEAVAGAKVEVSKIKELPPMPALQSLFNGNNTDGWTPHVKLPNHWKVEKGILGRLSARLLTPDP